MRGVPIVLGLAMMEATNNDVQTAGGVVIGVSIPTAIVVDSVLIAGETVVVPAMLGPSWHPVRL